MGIDEPGIRRGTLNVPSINGVSSASQTHIDRKRWLVLMVLCLCLMVVGIDGTIVNVALPSLVRELGATSSQLQWIVDAYMIVFASFLLLAGNTGDRLGRRRFLIIGMLLFAAGSTGSALVSTPDSLIAFRALQGFGGAFIMPSTLSILANVFTDDTERAKAIAVWAGVSALGVAVGPLAGGYLLGRFWWGSIFLVNLPIIAVVITATLLVVPESRDPHEEPLDFVGTLLSVVGLVALLYGIIEGPSNGWGDATVLGAFTIAALILSFFVWWEQRSDHPIVDVSFFKNPRFTAASIAIMLVFFAMFGSMFFISQYLQFVLGYSALHAGVALVPIAATVMVAAPTSARLVVRFGTKRVVTTGLLLVAVAMITFSRVSIHSGYGLVAVVLVIIGAGMGFAMAPATESIMGSLPPAKAGIGSAINDTTRQIGGALGVAIMGSITSAVYASSLAGSPSFKALEVASPQAASAVKNSVGSASTISASLPEAIRGPITAAANEAFVKGIDRTVFAGAAVALIGALIAYLFLPATAPHRASADEPTTTPDDVLDPRVEGATHQLAEMYRTFPVPDTGDLRADLYHYVEGLGAALSEPRSRQIFADLIAESANEPVLRQALRDRVLTPRRGELACRLNRGKDHLEVPIESAVDQLVGPLYFRSLVAGGDIDDAFITSVVDNLVGADAVTTALADARDGTSH